MSSLGRKTIFYLFAGLFLLLVPAVLLYGQGYRINFKEKTVAETGSIYVETQPKNAVVTIDGQVEKDRTPLLINELFEGFYDVEVSLNGYQTWRQRAEIEQRKSILYSAIDLFLTEPTQTKLVDNVDSLLRSRTGQYLLLKKEGSFALFNKNQNVVQWEIEQTLQNPIVLSWAPSDDWVLIQDEKRFYALNTSNGDLDRVFSQFSSIQHIHLMENSRALLVLRSEIIEYNLQSHEIIQRTPTRNILDATLQNNALYLLQSHGSGNRVSVLNDEELEIGDTILPRSISSFYEGPEGFIIAYEPEGAAYLISKDLSLDKLTDQFLAAESFKNGLFIVDKYAVLFQQGQQPTQTLVRQQNIIEYAERYNDDSGSILYLSEGAVTAFDTVYKPSVNAFTLTKTETQDFSGSPREGEVYILQNGSLILLEIQ